MILMGLARLGKDAELRYVPSGEAVTSLNLAFNHGKKQEDGNRKTQWVDAALWGKQAEGLVKYLIKGTLLSVIIDAPHIQPYDKKDGGQGFKLVGRVMNIEFAGSNKSSEGTGDAKVQQQASAYGQNTRSAPQHEAPPTNAYQGSASSYDDYDDDIPFN